MSNILIQHGTEYTSAELFDVQGDQVMFTVEGGPLQQERFLRTYDNDDNVKVYVLKEPGISRGNYVRVRYTSEELKAHEEDAGHANHLLACRFYGPKSFEGIENRTFKINNNEFTVPIEKDGGEWEDVKYHTLKLEPPVEGASEIMVPTAWIEALPAEEQKRAQVEEEARSVLARLDQLRQGDRNSLLEEYRGLSQRLASIVERLQAINNKSPEQYVIQMVNAKYRFAEAILQDKRVLKVEERDDSIFVTTDYLDCKFQGYKTDDGELTVPLGPLEIELLKNGSNPRFRYLTDSRIDGHPHDLGGGRLCTGSYTRQYAKLIGENDIYSAFQIAIEVLMNANLDDVAQNPNESFQYWTEEFDIDFREDDPNEIQDKINEHMVPYLEKEYKKWKPNFPKQHVFDAEEYDENLIREVVEEITKE